jgi:predicted aspartyl protease
VRRLHLLLLCLLLSGIGAAEAGAAVSVPIEIEQNLVIVRVRIGGSPPLAFLVDTGASASVIASDRLADAGLAAGASVAATGQGGTLDASAVRGAVLRIGPVRLAPDSIAAVDLAGLSAGLGRRIDGILGHELFERYVVRIDYDRRRLTLFEPGEAGGGGTAIPIEIRDGTPFVAATLSQSGESVPARLLVDIGASSALTLYADFVAAHPGLIPMRTLVLTGGAILPGRFRAQTGRLGALMLGPLRFVGPIANFSSNAGGDDAAPGDAGQIGGELLSRFTATYDYRQGWMRLRPGRRYRAPLRFDASGLSLTSAAPDFAVKRVRLVLPDTPAAEAGLLPGDRLLRFDGTPAGRLTLGRIRAALRQPGRAHRLEILRDGRRLPIRLVTRTLI